MKKLIFTTLILLLTKNIYSLEKIKLSLDWVPQAEHGGFFQAIANDYYKEVGLEVEIIPAVPQKSPQKFTSTLLTVASATPIHTNKSARHCGEVLELEWAKGRNEE